jgi:hypothetical protein
VVLPALLLLVMRLAGGRGGPVVRRPRPDSAPVRGPGTATALKTGWVPNHEP